MSEQGAGSTSDTDAESEKVQARRMKTRNRVMRGDGGSEQSHARRHRVITETESGHSWSSG